MNKIQDVNNNNKMRFVRNIETLKNEDITGNIDISEFEVIADAHIIGIFDYGPYCFGIWEFSDKSPGEKRKLFLRLKEKSNSEMYSSTHATTDGFYYGGGIGDELITLFSLFLRRRLELGHHLRFNDQPQYFSTGKHGWIDESLIKGETKLVGIKEWLMLVEGLNSIYHQKFILAVKLYHQALMMIEAQPDLAYLTLVSAIETLCQDHEIEIPTLAELDGNLARLIHSVENTELKNKIEQRILKRERFISRRFVDFILYHIEENFWNDKNRPEHGRIEPDRLPDCLKRIYTQRSRTLHVGESFPAYIFIAPPYRWEINGSYVRAGGKKWEPKDFIPYPHFFERLVNHVLKTFLKKNQEND